VNWQAAAKAARRLEFRCRRALWESWSGAAASALRGKGLEFEEVRPYQPGDEARDIDWKVTARRGSAYVKRFVEERQRTVWLILDETRSMEAGGGRSKREAAIEALGVLAFAAVDQDDQVGLWTFGERRLSLPARSGRNHVLRLFAELLRGERGRAAEGLRTLAEVVDRLRRAARKRSVVAVASDFLFADAAKPIVSLSGRHETTAIAVQGAWENSLPLLGPIRFRDVESGRRGWVDAGDRRVRSAYEAWSSRRTASLEREVRRVGGSWVAVGPEESGIGAMVRAFGGPRPSAATGTARVKG
jgi:uncharacterized protein (DUF58 family)